VRSVEVLRVVDGDTVDVLIDLGFSTHRKIRVRLDGIDAPETRTRDAAEKLRGYAAKSWLETKLTEAKVVSIKTIKSGSTGKYGRYLGILYADGVNLNQSMLKEGLAKVYGS
jgi:micrococcal nuclease